MFKIREKKKPTLPQPVDDELEFSFPSLIDNALNDGIKFSTDYFEVQTGLGQKDLVAPSSLNQVGIHVL